MFFCSQKKKTNYFASVKICDFHFLSLKLLHHSKRQTTGAAHYRGQKGSLNVLIKKSSNVILIWLIQLFCQNNVSSLRLVSFHPSLKCSQNLLKKNLLFRLIRLLERLSLCLLFTLIHLLVSLCLPPHASSTHPSVYLSICQWVQGQLHPGPAGSGQTGRLQGWWPHYGRGELRRI